MPSRRSVLAGTTSLLAAGAGCTGVLDRSSPEPALRDVTLRNTDDEAHAVAVRLSHEGEVIVDETYDLDPWPYGDEGGADSGGTGTTTGKNATATDGNRTTANDDGTAAAGKDATTADDAPDHLAAITDAWDSPRGEFIAEVRVDDRDPVEFRLDDGFDQGTTYRYEIRIEEDGSISTWATVLDATATTAA